MLAVMTFNYWILVSAVLGAGIGYLLVRPAVHAMCFSRLHTPLDVNLTSAEGREQNEILIEPPGDGELGEMCENPSNKTDNQALFTENTDFNGRLLEQKDLVSGDIIL